MNKKIVWLLFIICVYGCKEKVLYPTHYKFDFCKTCITVQDAVDYEIKLSSIKISQLSDFQHVRIFKKNYVPDLAVKGTFSDTEHDLYFVRKDTALNNFVITCYEMWYNDSINILPLNKIIISRVQKKLFFYDSYFDSLVNLNFTKPFDIKLQRGIAIAVEDSMANLFNKKGI